MSMVESMQTLDRLPLGFGRLSARQLSSGSPQSARLVNANDARSLVKWRARARGGDDAAAPLESQLAAARRVSIAARNRRLARRVDDAHTTSRFARLTIR